MFSGFSYTKLKVCLRTRTKSSVPIRLSPALVGLPNAKFQSPHQETLFSVSFQSFPPSFHELTWPLHSLSPLKIFSLGFRVSLTKYGLSHEAENAAACEKSQTNCWRLYQV